eukprot:1419922-Heterocapsa_arctica.AAC.1
MLLFPAALPGTRADAVAEVCPPKAESLTRSSPAPFLMRHAPRCRRGPLWRVDLADVVGPLGAREEQNPEGFVP